VLGCRDEQGGTMKLNFYTVFAAGEEKHGGKLPLGLQKQVDQKGQLPPGLEKR
jgi:hypothetical protein